MISQHISSTNPLNYSTNACIPSHYNRPISPPSNNSLPSIHSLKEFTNQYSNSPVRTATNSHPHQQHYYPLTHHAVDKQYSHVQPLVNNHSNSNSNSSHSDAVSSEDSNTSNHVNRSSHLPSPIKVKGNKSYNKQKVKSPNTNTTTGGIKKKRKTKKNKIIIATSELVRCMTLPQTVASKKLKVSLSTLKRRFYELSVGRWPSIASPNETGSSKSEEDMYVESTDASPEQKLSLSFILNKKDCPESSVIDNLSMVILKVAFTLNTNEEK